MYWRDCDEERSTITYKGDIGFIDLRVAMHVENEKGQSKYQTHFSLRMIDLARDAWAGISEI